MVLGDGDTTSDRVGEKGVGVVVDDPVGVLDLGGLHTRRRRKSVRPSRTGGEAKIKKERRGGGMDGEERERDGRERTRK